MLDELKALVAVAHTGSMERAAADLFLTPSALTRRIQRLEAELGSVLLDRHFKPPKLTRAGVEVLERSQTVLSSLSDLKASLAGNAAPTGAFRLGLSHALAQPEISRAIIALGHKFPRLLPRIASLTSCNMLAQLRAGELDAALVIFPTAMALPSDLEGVALAQERIRFVAGRGCAPRRSSKAPEFYRRSWVLNPAGCLVRAEIERSLERLGAPLTVAAELHSPELQVALIGGNVGVGALRESFLRTHAARAPLHVVDHPDFRITIRVAFLYGRHLGGRERAARELQTLLQQNFAHRNR